MLNRRFLHESPTVLLTIHMCNMTVFIEIEDLVFRFHWDVPSLQSEVSWPDQYHNDIPGTEQIDAERTKKHE